MESSRTKDERLAERVAGHLINVDWPVGRVIAEVAACERIAASSLHGLITADALGIPRKWEWFDRVQGDGFKFHDYAAALGQRIEPGVWMEANRDRVLAMRAALLDALHSLGEHRPKAE